MKILVCASGHDKSDGFIGTYPYEIETNNPCIVNADEIIIEGEGVETLIEKMRIAGYVLDDIIRLRRKTLMVSCIPDVVQEMRDRASYAGLILTDYISNNELDGIVAEAKLKSNQ